MNRRFFLAWVAVTLTAYPLIAFGAKFVEIMRFDIGEGVSQLGFEDGDTGNLVARLKSVGISGASVIYDRVNGRMLFVGSDGTTTKVKLLADVHSVVESALVLSDGSVVVSYGANLLLYGSSGVMIKRLSGVYFDVIQELGDKILAKDEKRDAYVFIDRDLKIVNRSKDRPIASGVKSEINDVKRIVGDRGCFLFHEKVVVSDYRVLDNVIMFSDGGDMGRVELNSRTTTTWERPRWGGGRRMAHLIPSVENPELRHGPVVLGEDGQFYELGRSSEQYVLGRWNLAELQQKTFELAPIPSPSFIPIGNKSTSVGEDFDFLVEINAQEGPFEISAAPLPKGAELMTSFRGQLTAGFSWKPRPSQVGVHTITFTAENMYCEKTTETITITVSE